tara:strand:+ start:4678 stop:5082 length:405 start_codon:yes stop_codon:yes gene_type:complete
MSGHRVLNDLLRAFVDGPGKVSPVANDDGSGDAVLGDNRLVQFADVNWDGDANHIITLPSPRPGMVVVIAGKTTGGELRTNDPATVGINGGTGANAESAIAANQMVICICNSTTDWRAFTIAANGTTAGLEAAS